MKAPKLIQLLNVNGDPAGLYFLSKENMDIEQGKAIIDNVIEKEYQREKLEA